MLVEILVIVGVAGLVSACAAWGCPSMLKKKEHKGMKEEREGGEQISLRMMIFTQGQCGRCLLPNDRDLNKLKNSETTSVNREKSKTDKFWIKYFFILLT